MRRILNLCSGLLVAFAVILVAMGVLSNLGFGHVAPAEGLRLTSSFTSIGAVPAGTQTEAAIELENRSSEAVTILGVTRACYPACCVDGLGLPMSVPAHGRAMVRCLVRTKAPARGDFSVPVAIYTARDGQPEVAVEIRGNLLPPVAPHPPQG